MKKTQLTRQSDLERAIPTPNQQNKKAVGDTIWSEDFSVAETLTVEPTESERKKDLDRFIEIMIAIGEEAQEIVEAK